ncbi:MAG TPA: cytochrome b/b6 domain-containing protein [Paucimonas sp.]|nr:cytochrome b/b6 domain-containing protein [Paucimonas sp.]
MKKIRVWDLPTRLFHWALALLVIGAIVFEKIGGNEIVWHFRCGYAALALVLFRILWGIFGTRYARFSSFLYQPRDIVAYAKSFLSSSSARHIGHNPLGGLSVVALLGVILLQASTGLWSNDDIANEGPLAKFISKELSDQFTRFHTEIGANLIYLFIGLHITAILWYRFRKKQNLIAPMITGDAETEAEAATADDSWRMRGLALVLAALCAAFVYFVVTLQP